MRRQAGACFESRPSPLRPLVYLPVKLSPSCTRTSRDLCTPVKNATRPWRSTDPQAIPGMSESSPVSLGEPSRWSAAQLSLAVKGTFPVVHGRGDPWITKLTLSSRYPLTVPFFVNDTENV